jgi:hypothetical protein
LPHAAFLLWMASSGVRVTGALACPTTAAVEQRLSELTSPRSDEAWVAEIAATSGGVEISLLDAGGQAIWRREFPKDLPCSELADVMATVLASWLSDLRAQPARAEPLPGPVGVASPPATATAIRSPLSWGVVLAATGSFGGPGFAPGVLLDVGAGPARSAWALHLMGAYEGPRQLPIEPGSVSFQDWQAGVGASYALLARPFYRLEIIGYFVLSFLRLNGLGFTVDTTSNSVDPGFDLGARLFLFDGPWRPWVGMGATLWLREEVPLIQGVTSSTSLPRVGGMVGVGLAWGSH